jgi:polyphenol oxidase
MTRSAMLQRVEHSSGAVFLRSPLLAAAGIPHAFSTRIGGISRGPFASLNFGNPNPCDDRDPIENIGEHWRRLLAAAGAEGRQLVEVHQVHGRDVHRVERDQPAHPGPKDTKADALITDDAARALAVRTADCLPILIATRDGSRVAAIHAGWRGIAANVIAATVEAFNSNNLISAIGPGIGFDAFEVGPEVVEQLRISVGEGLRVKTGPAGTPHVDLSHAAMLQLQSLGVRDIDTTDLCTFRDRELFFSHRRDQGMTGRMASVISPRF